MLSKKIVISMLIIVFVIGVIIIIVNLNDSENNIEVSSPPEEVIQTDPIISVIGRSVEEREIKTYEFGDGSQRLLFVGGIHGGYEWNSVVLAYEMIDYLEENPDFIPENLSISIIPSLNPDGAYDVVGVEGRFSSLDVPVVIENGLGRFNSREVDLNRNFDCKWQPESTWKDQVVSAGTEAFSEPETVALRDYVLATNPDAVIFWHSKANTVYASECEFGVLPETIEIMNLYSLAAKYNSVESFDAYPVTGDAEGWLASINIPAITVELETHETIEFDRNLAGVRSLLDYYSGK